MDYERLLIAKLAQKQQIENALMAGIREDHFTSAELSEIFAFCATHARKYRQPPSFMTVKEAFPGHHFELSDESFEFIQEQFVKQIKRRRAIEATRDLAVALDDPDMVGEIDQLFLQKARELSLIVPSSSLGRYSDMEHRIYEYETQDPDSHLGIFMGIPTFDNVTQGIQPHEYLSIVGWQGTGKSTLAQWILYNAYKQKKTPMYISLEMEKKALFRKWDTMALQFEYAKLKKNELSLNDLDRWKKAADEVKKAAQDKMQPRDIVVLDDVHGLTVDRVYAEIHRYRPDIVCIDYISLMDINRSAGNQMWEKVTYITQALKQIARSSGIPIIGIAQTNIDSAESGAKLENISYSRSIGQDSDLVIGLYANDDMRIEKKMQVRLLKNRDGMTINEDLFWNPDRMQFGEYRLSDAMQARAQEIANPLTSSEGELVKAAD